MLNKELIMFNSIDIFLKNKEIVANYYYDDFEKEYILDDKTRQSLSLEEYNETMGQIIDFECEAKAIEETEKSMMGVL